MASTAYRKVTARDWLLFALMLLLPSFAFSETGYDAWLRYARLDSKDAAQYASLPDKIVAVEASAIMSSAESELLRGINGLLGKTLRLQTAADYSGVILLATRKNLATFDKSLDLSEVANLQGDGYCLKWFESNGKQSLAIVGTTDRGALYGVFALLRMIATQKPIDRLDICASPAAPIRILNQWDNLDGSIERGYAGKSIFWENDHVVKDLSRVRDYARLMASVGINGCSINNVNADARVVTDEYLPELSRVADAFRPWGVRLYVSLNFASPRDVGGVKTFDPLDPAAVAFWKQAVDNVYRAIPDLGGFVLKADSEGRLGPSEYGRTHADAANVIARALKPYSGILFYRGFVYDHTMDWRNLKNDRAKAAYDNFHKPDGQFDDNVVIQIKN